jgi:MoxR-like ATPase
LPDQQQKLFYLESQRAARIQGLLAYYIKRVESFFDTGNGGVSLNQSESSMEPVGKEAGVLAEPLEQGIEHVRRAADLVRDAIRQVIIGKDTEIDLLLVALLCEGHVLIEDVPGVGKTMLAKTLARTLGCTFQRIQCTPDLLPTDMTGITYFNQKTGEFAFRPGPLMTQIVLADEINRATPRTQSALLEAMEERQISVERETLPLPRPFLVIATQNPIELEGTFPLPEAQLDRFMLRLRMGYPEVEEERAILRRFRHAQPLHEVQPVLSAQDLLALQQIVKQVIVTESVETYLLEVVRATRSQVSIELGASPRAALALEHACQALAAIHGRTFVRPDEVKQLAQTVLAHRLILSAQARLRGRAAEQTIAEVLAAVPTPVEEVGMADSAVVGSIQGGLQKEQR